MANLPDCPWCGEKMRFDADSVHCWFKCDNCLAASPKALREWDVAKSTKDNWTDNEQHALRLTKEVEWNVHPPRWISVEERLPDGVCLAVNGCGAMLVGYIEYDKYSVETRYSCEDHDTGVGVLDITHWMPLPEPPKED